MSKKRARMYGFMMTVMCVITLLSNFAAVKIAKFLVFDIPVDCGIFIFPLGYVVSDLFQDEFGLKEANYATFLSMVINVAAMIFMMIMVSVPVYPGWTGQASFADVFRTSSRVVIASTLAYTSRFINNSVFASLKRKRRGFFASSLSSTTLAQIFDTFLFELIAFGGVLPMADFVCQAVFAFVAAIAMEAIATTIASAIRSYVQ